jgi:hypothetical protein
VIAGVWQIQKPHMKARAQVGVGVSALGQNFFFIGKRQFLLFRPSND